MRRKGKKMRKNGIKEQKNLEVYAEIINFAPENK